MAKWIAVEKASAGQRHAVACPNVIGRTEKIIAQNKRACAGSLAIFHYLQVPRTCSTGVWFPGVSFFWCCVCFVLLSHKPRNFRSVFLSSFFYIHASRWAHMSFHLFFLFGNTTFSKYYFLHYHFLLNREYVARFSRPDSVLLPRDHGLDFSY